MKSAKPLLSGRVAIITGAGKGLGRAYALHFASLGARVLVNNRGSPGQVGNATADRVVEEIQSQGGEAIADYESVEAVGASERMVASALARFGRLDIIVANAGIDSARSFHKQSMTDFESVMRINFHAVAELLHAAWPRLRAASYGRIILSSSTAGLYGNFGQTAYASSKAALLGLMKSLALEGESLGIRVNAIAPYAVTALTRPWFPPGQVEQFSAEAVAPLVAALASEQCTLSGQTIVAGAGRGRLIRNAQSQTAPLGEGALRELTALVALYSEHQPVSATAQFEEFMASL